MVIELKSDRSGDKERQIHLQVWEVSWWVQVAGLAFWKPALFVWVRPTFVAQQTHITLHRKGPAIRVYCLAEQGDL